MQTLTTRAVLAILFVSMLAGGCGRSTDNLIEDLYSNNSQVRLNAATRLQTKRGDHETVLKLIELMSGKDQRAAFIATQVLGSLSDSSAVEPLGKMTRHPDPEFRRQACWSLGTLGTPSGLPYLATCLKDSTAEVRHAAVYALGYLYDTRAIKYIYPMFRDEADSVRAAAIHSLYMYRKIDGTEARASDLAITLNDRSEMVRYIAVQALGGGFADSTVAGDLLIEALDDENKHVRLEAIRSIAKIKYKKAVPYMKEMYDTATVEEEYEITETIKQISGEVFPPAETG